MQELDVMRSFKGKRNLTRILCVSTAIILISMLSACTKDISKYKPTSGDTSEAVTTTVSAVPAATTTAPASTASAPDDLKTGWCSASTMNIRSGAGTDYGAIGGLKLGDKVEILGKEGDWYKIKFAKAKDGVGYVNAQFISSTEVAGAATAAAATTTAAQ